MPNQELTPIEQRIASLKPADPVIDHAQLMYDAGWAAAEAAVTKQKSPRVWKAAACLSTAAALMLSTQMLSTQVLPIRSATSPPNANQTIAPEPRISNGQTTTRTPFQTQNRYLSLRAKVLVDGMLVSENATFDDTDFASVPATSWHLMEQLLTPPSPSTL